MSKLQSCSTAYKATRLWKRKHSNFANYLDMRNGFIGLFNGLLSFIVTWIYTACIEVPAIKHTFTLEKYNFIEKLSVEDMGIVSKPMSKYIYYTLIFMYVYRYVGKSRLITCLLILYACIIWNVFNSLLNVDKHVKHYLKSIRCFGNALRWQN